MTKKSNRKKLDVPRLTIKKGPQADNKEASRIDNKEVSRMDNKKCSDSNDVYLQENISPSDMKVLVEHQAAKPVFFKLHRDNQKLVKYREDFFKLEKEHVETLTEYRDTLKEKSELQKKCTESLKEYGELQEKYKENLKHFMEMKEENSRHFMEMKKEYTKHNKELSAMVRLLIKQQKEQNAEYIQLRTECEEQIAKVEEMEKKNKEKDTQIKSLLGLLGGFREAIRVKFGRQVY